ncbi:MAG: hypothetical protein EPN14_04645 [Gallionella sp.]|nr:MAG: hypothetical protein EPN14_04645 [Gallionella sp.]
MMARLKKLLPALWVAVLVAASTPGCAQKRYTQNVDCRSCHAPGKVAGARDFSPIYANAASHHLVGVKYPLGLQSNPNFNQPSVRGADIAFFDRNGNGRPDHDEVLLFGADGAVTVECASCHEPHGNSPAPANAHLRFDNVGSAVCATCHNL